MKICVAQVQSVTGDILQNIRNHTEYINLAVSLGTDAIFFPELSLTGYMPALAKKLAITLDDKRLNVFQKISDTSRIIIGAGAPTQHQDGICISMIIFQPDQPRRLYSKQYLHKDEEPYFVSGNKSPLLRIGDQKIAIAICYEISVPAHCKTAYSNGAHIYIASVAKTRSGIDKALDRLNQISNKYSMTVLMANSVGKADGEDGSGKSSVWNDRGALIAQLNDSNEGLLILETDTEIATVIH